MIGSLVPDIEGIDWTYDDVAREMEDLEMSGDLEDEASPIETDDLTDDEILRASEEIRQDEG